MNEAIQSEAHLSAA